MSESNPNDGTWRGLSASVEQTRALGRAIAVHARAGDVIALHGELGAGKTQLVRGIAQGMGVPASAVSSPTFVIAHEYAAATAPPRDAHGGPPTVLVHVDAYRLNSPGELESAGLGDLSEMRLEAVVVIEWAERLGDGIADDLLDVRLTHAEGSGTTNRAIEIRAHGSWRAKLPSLIAALAGAGMEGTARTTVPSHRCPICSKPVTPTDATFPFCGKRCRTIDLGKWLKGDYRISRAIEEKDLDEE